MSYEQRFEVLELIGRGSFGNVRKVRRISDGRLCVRKEITYIHMNSKERSQLIDEFRILGSLNHPNIVEYIYHEHVPEEHSVHLYMEYCDGGDLSKIIKNYKQNQKYVPEDLVWSIFTQLIMALYRCHYGVNPPALKNIFKTADEDEEPEEEEDHKGGNNNQYKYSVSGNDEPSVINNEMIIIHRDIKPDNVFLLKDNKVKLGDFGLAKLLLSDNDFATTYVGTPYYMSPEVLMDKPYTPLSDIWSLGCVMYELCSLQPPFQAKTHLQLQNKIKEGKFPNIPNHYSQKLRMTINACIMVDVNQRPSTFILLQEISIKIFRKQLELNEKQEFLVNFEKNLLKKENLLLLKDKQRIDEEVNKQLNHQKKLIESEIEEIRIQYQKEFNYVVDQAVLERMKFLLSSPEFMKQLISNNNVTEANKLKEREIQLMSQQFNQRNGNILKQTNSNIINTTNNGVNYKKVFDDYNNPNVYGGVTGSQNLNMNGINVLNKNNNNNFITKKKKYYNELYEENTTSPFLRGFNSDL